MASQPSGHRAVFHSLHAYCGAGHAWHQLNFAARVQGNDLFTRCVCRSGMLNEKGLHGRHRELLIGNRGGEPLGQRGIGSRKEPPEDSAELLAVGQGSGFRVQVR